jgi:hypothetical protein
MKVAGGGSVPLVKVRNDYEAGKLLMDEDSMSGSKEGL